MSDDCISEKDNILINKNNFLTTLVWGGLLDKAKCGELARAIDLCVVEQEPCDDVISRQVIKEQMIKYGFHAPDMTVTEFVEDLPSVNPQELCGDEYIKVPKKALKYRTAGMVAYNVAWLREHWQMEMDIVCGVKPCEDAISRQLVLALQYRIDDSVTLSTRDVINVEDIEELPSVTPKSRIGKWIDNHNGTYTCDQCGCKHSRSKYCPNCGIKMEVEG